MRYAALATEDDAVVDAGRRNAVSPLELAQGPLYLVLAGAFGVLVGRWTRRVYAAAFGAVVLSFRPWRCCPGSCSTTAYPVAITAP